MPLCPGRAGALALVLTLTTSIATTSIATPALAGSGRAGRPVMGTILQVSVVATSDDAARRMAQRCIAIGERWDDVLTTWREEGELSRLNAAAGKGPSAVSAELRAALERMKQAARATGGAFEPGVGPVVHRLRRGDAVTEAHRRAATTLGIERSLVLTDAAATLSEGAALDAGGIGKGLALDEMIAYLKDAGAEAAFIDFGGSSQVAFGRPDDGSSGWTLVVAGAELGVALGTFTLVGGSISTSRASEPGSPAGAIIDPQSGKPVAPPVVATVHADDATTAEYWSTALVVLGRAGLGPAREAGVEALVVDAQGLALTPGFALERAGVPASP